ncbi:MAG: hypothetical protein E7410_01365 [Ruminococcaceae bacterium]|nr:hypothetical protein [Oscillospiraceae bacterium]
MITTEQSNKAVDFITEKINPVFIYFADHMMSENIFDVAYYSEQSIDEYTVCLFENELSNILGVPVELNNLNECDTEFVGEILSDGETVYCKSELEKTRFLNRIAREFESIRINRAMLINRMKECDSIYEQ